MELSLDGWLGASGVVDLIWDSKVLLKELIDIMQTVSGRVMHRC